MIRFLPFAVLACLLSSVTLSLTSCSSLKREFYGSPPALVVATTNPATGVITVTPLPGPISVIPPLTEHLQVSAQIAEAVVPGPWGSLTAAVLNLLATGAAAFATFRARSAAAHNADTISKAAALPATAVETKKG